MAAGHLSRDGLYSTLKYTMAMARDDSDVIFAQLRCNEELFIKFSKCKNPFYFFSIF